MIRNQRNQVELSAYLNPAVAWPNYGLNCWAAPAEEAATHRDLADAVLKTGGTYVDCYRFHGGILDGRGDWKGAQEWYSKAIKLAPDLPAGTTRAALRFQSTVT